MMYQPVKRLLPSAAISILLHAIVGMLLFWAFATRTPTDALPGTAHTDAAVDAGDAGTTPDHRVANDRASGSNPVQTRGETTHKVAPGEGFWIVARKYGISIEQLIDYNGLSTNHVLQVGDVLKIPPRKAP